MDRKQTDWHGIIGAVASGDQLAFLKLCRFITRVLQDMNATRYRSDWDDIVQDVVLSIIRAHAGGAIRDQAATAGYIRTVVRNRFIDRTRRASREVVEDEVEETEIEVPGSGSTPELSPAPSRFDVDRALEGLPDPQRVAVVSVYGMGMTYDEAAESSGIPLGSLKRYLRLGLESLESRLSGYRGAR